MRIYFTPYDIKVPFDQLQMHTRLRCDWFFNCSPSIWLKWPWKYVCKSDTSQDCPFSCHARYSKIPSTHYLIILPKLNMIKARWAKNGLARLGANHR